MGSVQDRLHNQKSRIRFSDFSPPSEIVALRYRIPPVHAVP